MAELTSPLPFALVPPGGTSRVEPEPPATGSSSKSPSKFCGSEVSLRVARAYWLAVVTMHALVAVYFYGYAAVYKRVASSSSSNSSSSSDVTTLSSTLAKKMRLLDFVTPVEVASSAIAICHAISIVNALISSFRSRELVFSPDIWLDGPDKKAALAAVQKRNRETWRVLKMLFAAYDKLEKRGLYLVQVFAVVQLALQVFQAAKLSHLVASAWLNRLMVAAIVANCWYIPLVHYVFRGGRRNAHKANPALEVLVHHGADSLLDVVYGIVVPLALFYPYRQSMNVVIGGGLTSSTLYYHDTWVINAVAEHTQIFVSSWTDFVAKMVPGIALLYQLRGLQTLLQVSRTTTLKRQITFKLPNVRLTTTPAVGTSGAVAPSGSTTTNTIEEEGKPPPRGKIRLFFDVVLLVAGVAVLSLHAHAESVASRGRDPGCLLEMRPWGTTKYACAVLEVSCSQRGMTGNRLDLDASLLKVEPHALRGLIFAHCPALSVTASIQSFSALQMLKFHNVTLVDWAQDAALTELKHPQLTRIFISQTNMSAIPPGLLSSDFPSNSVDDIQFCGTNLTTFPEDVHLKWTQVDTFVLELSPGITAFPEPLAKMPLQLLSLAGNAIRGIPDDLLAIQTSSFQELVLTNNPLQSLPSNIGNLTGFTALNIIDTNVSELPSAWLTKDFAVRPSISELIEIQAAGTPLCAKLTQDAHSTTNLAAITTGGWFLVNCVTTATRATVYPLDEELTWRAVNR